MDLTAELDELSHGLHRQRRLIELTVNRLHLAALVLEQRTQLPPRVSLREVDRVLQHLHHEELFRAVLVAGIAEALGTSCEPDLIEIIASAPRGVSGRLGDRQCRLVQAIDAADALSARLRLNPVATVTTVTSPRSTAVRGGRGVVLELEATVEPGTLAEAARRIVQPSLRDFICR
jgi:hypothetical protein